MSQNDSPPVSLPPVPTRPSWMPSEAFQHATSVASEAHDLLIAKYFAGQREHQGLLYEKKQGWNLIEEALDQVVYALTLRQQHEQLVELAESGSEADLREAVLKFCAE